MTYLTRAYRFGAFQPQAGIEAFEKAAARKRLLWCELIGIQNEYEERKAKIMASDEIAAAMSALLAAASPEDQRAAKKALRAARAQRAEKARPDLLALGSWRVDRFREAKQKAAAEGLHFGDYNSTVFQFNGAVLALAGRGAKVYEKNTRAADACVNQVMGDVSFAALFGGSQVRLETAVNRSAQRPGSRASRRRILRLSMTVRGPRNPLGPAKLILEFIEHRPVPPAANIVEVRAIRKQRPVICRDGVKMRHEWHVVFVARVPVAARTATRAAGLALTWKHNADEDDLLRFAVVASDGRTRDISLPYEHEGEWATRDELVASANDEISRARAAIYERKLRGRRTMWLREQAAALARQYGTIAVQKMDLSQKGVKNHGAPHEFVLALRHALKLRGGELIEVPCRRPDGDAAKLAKILAEAAKAHAANGESPSAGIAQTPPNQRDAA